jgi:arabinose-5-phosphate isomerase
LESGDLKDLENIKSNIAIELEGVSSLLQSIDNDPSLARALIGSVEAMAKCKGRVIVSGVGKSGHIGRKIAATLSSTGTPAYFVHPTEASHGDLGMIGTEDIIICLSWSGETQELVNVVAYANRFNVTLISLTSNPNSTLAKNASIAIILPKVRECCPHGLAPTTSAMLQLAIGDALAIALLERRGFSATDFRTFHPGGKLGSQLKVAADFAHTGERMPLVELGTSMADVIVSMSAKGFGVVGVTNSFGKLIGIVTDGDLRRHMAGDLLSRPVDSVMTSNPRTVLTTVLAGATLELMERDKITVLFLVNENGAAVGILHIHDLLRAGVA